MTQGQAGRPLPARYEFWLALLVTAVLLLGTLTLWQRHVRSLAAQQTDELLAQARELEELWRNKLSTAELLLRSMRGFWEGSSDITETEFRDYVEALRLDRTIPHVAALGFLTHEAGQYRWLLRSRQREAPQEASGTARLLEHPESLRLAAGMPGEVQLAGVDASGLFLLLPAAPPRERAGAGSEREVYALVYLDAEAMLLEMRRRLGSGARFSIQPQPSDQAALAASGPEQVLRPLAYAGQQWSLRLLPATDEAAAVLARAPAWLAGLGLVLSLTLGLLSWHGLGHARRRRAAAAELDRRVRELTLDLNATLDAVPDLLFEFDRAGRYLSYRASRPELLRVPPAQFIGRTVHEVLPAEAAGQVMAALEEADRCGRSQGRCIQLELPDGVHGFELSVARKFTLGGEPRFIVLSQDVSVRKQAEQALAETSQRYQRLFADNPVPMWVYDVETLAFLDINDAAMRQYGYGRAEFLAMTLRDIRPAEDVGALERNVQAQCRQVAGRPELWRHRRKDGTLFPVEITAHAIEFEGRSARLVLAMDISERVRVERQVSTMAYYDTLTGLPNRASFEQAAAAALARCQAERGCGAAILIDLDHFKVVNDYWGHRSGDEMLAVVGQRLRDQLPEGALLYRLGGDEFLVLLTEGCEDLTRAAAMAQDCCRRVHEALRVPIAAHGREHYSSASMGIALIGEKQLEVGELLSQADAAMYQAKGQGRNTYCFFDQGLQRSLARRTELEAELRLALERNELHLVYQPQVDSQGRLLGAEALLRWTHPTQGPVSPTEFVPLAENSGLILPIGNWVLINACRTLAAWQSRPESAGLCLAVNVSAKQFHSADFQQQVLSALQLSGARANGLKLELTESILAVDLDGIVQKMQALKRHGLTFALDDFGTGYSSLNYLKRLPLDQLKIDQSFVRELLDNRHDAAIVRTVISLGVSLGLEVIAEGVETEAHRQFLEREGCERFQGYLFSHPLTLPAWKQFVAAWRAGKDALRSAAQ